jgi:hypothetical protein
VKKSAVFLLSAVLLSGCQSPSVAIDVDFATTNFGFINSGGYKPGSFFAWDRTKDTVAYLGDIDGFAPADASVPGTDQETTYDAGISIDADLELVKKAQLEAAIRNQSRFVVKDARRVAYNEVYTKISNTLNASVNSGGNLIDEWGLKAAAQSGNTYFLLIRDVTFGDELELQINREAKAGASFPIKVADATVQVSVHGGGLGRISGNDKVMLFNFYVLRPYFDTSSGESKVAFEIVRGVDLRGFTKLFRKVGQFS